MKSSNQHPTFCFLVRHRPTRSVVVHAVVLDDGTLQFLRVTPDAGALPDTRRLAVNMFKNRRALRLAILDLFRKEGG